MYWFKTGSAILALAVVCGCTRTGQTPSSDSAAADRPNVILIITDDQGYGDFGVTGNPVLRTPNLDAMAERSAWMSTFYVSPVCAPTRASLMTGRYNYRTRVVDTYIGRAMMEPAEVTMAEVLQGAGYRTGIFGKWHLGDNYPMRPIDQGFEEALVHRGGGIGQPSDPPGGEGRYTDPILFHNGEPVQMEGYCTDLYFDAALDWIEARDDADEPFFAYIATNAPHGPYHDVPEALLAEYRAMDLSDDRFPQNVGHPLPGTDNLDTRARIFAMITNIDQNVGRLFDRLDALDLTDDTIVMFMVDNGPNSNRYVAGMHGRKSFVHEGGIRSPFFVHWPTVLDSTRRADAFAAHIDVLPTLIDALRIPPPEGVRFDGRSFWPDLTGARDDAPDRTLVIQTHRGDAPVRYHHFMIRDDRWKLLHASGFGNETFDGAPDFELYDLATDPLEMTDLADERPDVVAGLRAAYDDWFEDVSATRPDNFAPPRIVVGSPEEPTSVLTRQDWRHVEDRPWSRNSNGFWLLEAEEGRYDVALRFPPAETAGPLTLEIGDARESLALAPGDSTAVFEDVVLPAGPTRLQATLDVGDDPRGPWQVDVVRSLD